jgi:cytochrome c oxidase assembly protein subunit 15
MRLVVLALAALMLVITTTSAYIRLVQAGIGCEDWPACYGANATLPQPGVVALPEDDPLFVPRALHRVTASVAGVLVAIIVFVGWGEWTRRRARWVAVALVLLAAGLAWLGRATPSPLPVVTLANLLGGLAMFALAVRLLEPQAGRFAAPPVALLGWTRAALVLALVQIALGGLIGARFGATACNALPLCDALGAIGADTLTALNPFSADSTADPGGKTLLHVLHRLVAIALSLAMLRVTQLIWHQATHLRRHAAIALALVALQIASGALFVLQPGIAFALAHNVGAALLLAALAAIGVSFANSRLAGGRA